MKFIDLYAGIGGFRYALESLGHECVFSAEKDKFAIETYYKNFPSHNPSFDMDSLQNMSDDEINETIPDHDILTAGFPCQPFSIGGKKLGFEDTRGTQFFNILKILKVKKTRFILLENVSNIINHDNGNTFKTIRNSLWELGYKIQNEPVILSPTLVGIPQRRMRAFFYAELNAEVKSLPTFKKETFIDILGDYDKTDVLDTYYQKVIDAWEEFVQNVKSPNNNKIPDLWIDDMINFTKKSPEFPSWKNQYLDKMIEFYKFNKDFIDRWIIKYNVLSFSKRERKFEWRAGKSSKSFKDKILILRTSGLRIMNNEIFPTLVAMAQTPIIYDTKINKYRHISIIEACRLQSFPRHFIPSNNKSQTMKQLGNAVNVKLVTAIANKLLAK